MGNKWRRRNYFIKKELQGLYIFTFFVLVFMGCILFSAIFSLLSADTMSITYKDSTLQLGKTPVILLKEILKAQWIFIVIGGAIVVVISMFLTHRFAGPIFRFEKSLEAMIGRDHSFRITLRSGDEAKELAEMINEYNSRISEDIREMTAMAEALREDLAAIADSPTPEEAQRALAKAGAKAVGLLEKLSTYKTKNDR